MGAVILGEDERRRSQGSGVIVGTSRVEVLSGVWGADGRGGSSGRYISPLIPLIRLIEAVFLRFDMDCCGFCNSLLICFVDCVFCC